jgi:thermostable 8-oxoguanine DNA glycosylase
MADDNLKDGLACYDPENRVFPKLAASSQLSKRDVLLILKWKLARLKKVNSRTVTDANTKKINEAVKTAGNIDRRVEALNDLSKIPGIGLAAATAILTVCHPDDFTIIDRRVLEQLTLYPPKLAAHKRTEYRTDDWTPEEYLDEYLPRVKERAELWKCSLRDADRALWGLSVQNQIEKIIAGSELPAS